GLGLGPVWDVTLQPSPKSGHKGINMKYKITTTTKSIHGRTYYQIQALKDFSKVKKGDLGGWIQSEKNLSQEGVCWVSGDGNARVSDKARVSDNAWVSDNA